MGVQGAAVGIQEGSDSREAGLGFGVFADAIGIPRPIVSSDVRSNPHSCVFDAGSTIIMQEKMVKVMGWYDNEWGYSCRTADLCSFMSDQGI